MSSLVRRCQRLPLLILACALSLVCVFPQPVAARSFAVTTSADRSVAGGCVSASPCSLRDAITAANSLTGADSISVPAGTYMLSSTLPLISDALTITGALSSTTKIDAGGITCAMVISKAVQVNLSNLTIRNGRDTRECSSYGSGIFNQGRLTISSSILSDNRSDYQSGGAVLNANGGTLTLIASIVRNNTAHRFGGGLSNDYGHLDWETGPQIPAPGGPMLIQDSQIISNSALHSGGGIFSGGQPLTIRGSSLISNSAGLEHGGAVAQKFEIAEAISSTLTSMVTITNSLIVSNTAGGNGGGLALTTFYDHLWARTLPPDLRLSSAILISGSSIISNSVVPGGGNGGGVYVGMPSAVHNGPLEWPISETLTVVNSTFAGNSATLGGAIYQQPSSTYTTTTAASTLASSMQLFSTTIAGNTARQGAGVVGDSVGGVSYMPALTTTIYSQNSILAGNTADSGKPQDCMGSLMSQGYNLVQNSLGCRITGTLTGMISGKDPLLGALQSTGPRSFTRALLMGSPAIDAAAPTGCRDPQGLPLTTDQRGSARSQDGNGDGVSRCDMGAYERDAAAPKPPQRELHLAFIER